MHKGDQHQIISIPVPVQSDSSLSDRCCSFRTDEEEAENTFGLGEARHFPRVKAKQFQTLGNSEERRFAVGDNVLARNWGRGPKWLPRTLVGFRRHVNLEIQTSQGHVGQVKWSYLDECDGPSAPEKPILPQPPMCCWKALLINHHFNHLHHSQSDQEDLPRRSSRVSWKPDRFQALWK